VLNTLWGSTIRKVKRIDVDPHVVGGTARATVLKGISRVTRCVT
jgi:hypothetical protein